ncbi:putative O-methyltransferase [Lophiotrema nucula]|uniref:Putative O-methyltransferase n=1 Tax=Lophiotrema nucula TaxID=690887 RepID=A0A6A5ZX80_9PLEO|nr:putative O-methyltransferase [Lophiotrema nucula]
MATTTEELIAALDALDVASFADDSFKRKSVRAAADRLLARVENPFERIWRLMWQFPMATGTLQTVLNLGIFEGWNQARGGPKTLEELHEYANTSVEIDVLRRLLRLLGSFHILEEVTEDTYKPTPLSMALGDRGSHVPDALDAGTNSLIPSATNLPAYLAKTGYREPIDPNSNSYVDVLPEHQPFFTRLQSNPVFGNQFVSLMTGWSDLKASWVDYFPTGSLLEGADLTSAPLLVDVGGGSGLDLTRFLKAHPAVPTESLVLQDTPDVLELAKLDSKIKLMPHNFFEPQPIIGARTYFFHAVFHDWSDPEAAKILTLIKEAMKPGYSKLLITEMILPPTGASDYQTAMDVFMMTILSAKERTEKVFTQLLESTGFRVVKFWKDLKGIETVVEAELA